MASCAAQGADPRVEASHLPARSPLSHQGATIRARRVYTAALTFRSQILLLPLCPPSFPFPLPPPYSPLFLLLLHPSPLPIPPSPFSFPGEAPSRSSGSFPPPPALLGALPASAFLSRGCRMDLSSLFAQLTSLPVTSLSTSVSLPLPSPLTLTPFDCRHLVCV